MPFLSPSAWRFAHESFLIACDSPKHGAIVRLRERLSGFRIIYECATDFVAIDKSKEVLVRFAHLDSSWVEWLHLYVKPESRSKDKCKEILEKVHRACDWRDEDGGGPTRGGPIGMFAGIRTYSELPQEVFTSKYWASGNAELPLSAENLKRDRAWRRVLLSKGWVMAFPNDKVDSDMANWKLRRDIRK